jgi:hypothetical protein
MTAPSDAAADQFNLSKIAPISILTDPMPIGRYRVPELIRRGLRNALHRRRPDQYTSSYRGHPAVTRSLIEGLRDSGLHFNHNPQVLDDLHGTVVVLAGTRTLNQAIKLKQSGLLSLLYAGPNIVTLPTDHQGILGSPEIDGVITPSPWVSSLYRDYCASLDGRLIAWPAGVDSTFWRPDAAQRRNAAVLYTKGEAATRPLAQQCSAWLTERGIEVIHIQYGQYTAQDYLQALQRARIMVAFSDSESQGIAWSEAWSADVPTLIFRQRQREFNGRMHACSSAPYLTDACGGFFDDARTFEGGFAGWDAELDRFRPREWLLEHMTDRICAMRLVAAIESQR